MLCDSGIVSVHQYQVLIKRPQDELFFHTVNRDVPFPDRKQCQDCALPSHETGGINIKPSRGQLRPCRQTFTQFWQPLQRLAGLSNVPPFLGSRVPAPALAEHRQGARSPFRSCFLPIETVPPLLLLVYCCQSKPVLTGSRVTC